MEMTPEFITGTGKKVKAATAAHQQQVEQGKQITDARISAHLTQICGSPGWSYLMTHFNTCGQKLLENEARYENGQLKTGACDPFELCVNQDLFETKLIPAVAYLHSIDYAHVGKNLRSDNESIKALNRFWNFMSNHCTTSISYIANMFGLPDRASALFAS